MSETGTRGGLAELKLGGIVAQAILLGCLAVAAIFVVHPHLAVRDADGFAYIMGARSFHGGTGYRSLVNEPLNHWPPGYSLLLSPFRDVLLAAKIINYSSFGVAVGLIYGLLRRSSWSWPAALGLTLALAAGYLRLLTNSAHADILTYAFFLLGLLTLQAGNSRLLPSLIWAFLIPIKLIAVVFLPPAAGADLLVSRWDLARTIRAYAPGVLLTIAAVLGVLVFNKMTMQTWIPASHEEPSLANLTSGAHRFLASIPREFLFNWHGSVTEFFPKIAFATCMLLALTCLVSLRFVPELRWLLVYGILCLLCSALLLGIRTYIPTVRLVGYGLIVLFLAARPAKWADVVWLLYGGASVLVGVVNALNVNSLGSTDPRYADLASQVRAHVRPDEVIATNSFHILDINANIASVPISDLSEAAGYNVLLQVTLPNYDPGSSAVTPLPQPGVEWCEQKRFTGGNLYRRCSSPYRSQG